MPSRVGIKRRLWWLALAAPLLAGLDRLPTTPLGLAPRLLDEQLQRAFFQLRGSRPTPADPLILAIDADSLELGGAPGSIRAAGFPSLAPDGCLALAAGPAGPAGGPGAGAGCRPRAVQHRVRRAQPVRPRRRPRLRRHPRPLARPGASGRSLWRAGAGGTGAEPAAAADPPVRRPRSHHPLAVALGHGGGIARPALDPGPAGRVSAAPAPSAGLPGAAGSTTGGTDGAELPPAPPEPWPRCPPGSCWRCRPPSGAAARC